MTVEDSGLIRKGWSIEVIPGDHQNKADVGASIAKRWFDVDKVDVVADVPNSGVALAVSNLVKEENKIFIASAAATSDLTNAQCTPNTLHWAYDTYTLANGTGTALTKAGGKDWYFITADYAFGTALERDTTAAVEKNGGRILGRVKHPLNTPDFSSFLLQAQAPKAQIIGLANAGGDTANAIRQVAEFGINRSGQKLAGLLLFVTDIHSLGLKVAQGLNFTETFYWDLNDQTRAFSKRFQDRNKTRHMPTMPQAGVYSGVFHYLKVLAAQDGNSHDGAKIVVAIKDLPTEDPLFGNGSIQPNGRKIHPAYLFEVKPPAESKGPWDYYKLIATIPANDAFTAFEASTCPLLRR